MSRRTIRAVDLFCGAGGTSTGLVRACESAGTRLELTAINHWDIAVETHAQNHPEAQHLCKPLDALDPRRTCPGRLDLLVASPECTHHSNARGGRPREEQSRASAWTVVDWASTLRPREILVENVPEFRTWGPLDERGRVLKRRRGETYRAWLAALRSLGYSVRERVLISADYGDPTTRRRLFVRARLGARAPSWPRASHARAGEAPLFSLPAWRAAREIIDWDLPGRSIFGRKKPLASATLRRIEEGLRRFGGEAAEPFLVLLRGTAGARGLDAPLPSITAGGEHLSLVQPYLVPLYGERHGQQPRTHDVADPVPTIPATGGGKFGLVEPFLLSQGGGGVARPVSQPSPTIVAKGAVQLVEPFLVPYYGTGVPHGCGEPVPAVTARDRHALVEPTARLDILFRMLQPHELAAAMGFPDDYRFAGNRADVVRQIGNAVSVGLAEALCSAAVAPTWRAAS